MIPKVIYMCDKTLTHIRKYSQNWKKLNPEYEIKLYDDQLCANFLLKEFSRFYYNIFMFILDGPIKADFWRVCILYKYGGIYIDADNEPLVSLSSFIEDVDFITCSSYWDEMNFNFNPNFIATKKENNIILNCIKTYIKYYNEKKKYSYWGWSIMQVFTENIQIKNYKKEDGIYYIDTNDTVSNVTDATDVIDATDTDSNATDATATDSNATNVIDATATDSNITNINTTDSNITNINATDVIATDSNVIDATATDSNATNVIDATAIDSNDTNVIDATAINANVANIVNIANVANIVNIANIDMTNIIKIQIIKEHFGNDHYDSHNTYKGMRVFNNRYKNWNCTNHSF